MEELEGLEETNPLVKPLEDLNSQLRKRIMVNEKQRSTAENAIAEVELFLSEEEREREAERVHKGKYVNAGEDCRSELQLLEREADNLLRDQTLRARRLLAKEMGNELAEKEDVYMLLTDRLRNLETECSGLIQDKKELGDALDTHTKAERDLEELMASAEESVATSRSGWEGLRRVEAEVVREREGAEEELERGRGRLPMVEREIERKGTLIHYLNKQVDLLKELKGLDLEQLHMISQSGASMQNLLGAFIKNWEKIKSQ